MDGLLFHPRKTMFRPMPEDDCPGNRCETQKNHIKKKEAGYNWRHKGAPPLLYVDNHVEVKNWLSTIPPSQRANAGKSEPTEAYGDWSDDPAHKK